MARQIQVGDKAPPFTLLDANGQQHSLTDSLVQGPVMLVFYPGDFTPVCTKQLCSYRDDYSSFQAYGIQILGISSDPVEKHQAFHARKSFPFAILSDPDCKVIDQYCGTSRLTPGRSRRANFVVSKDGMVRYAHIERVAVFFRKSEGVLSAVERLQQQGML